jgi:hypothetical protein
MRTRFLNGRTFRNAIALAPPASCRVPNIAIEMADDSMNFVTVIGTFDTGASITFLNSGTAGALGIFDPAQSALCQKQATLADGHKIIYYVHSIWVRPRNGGPVFRLFAGVSTALRNNLFGIDWLFYACIAVDSDQVHFLQD